MSIFFLFLLIMLFFLSLILSAKAFIKGYNQNSYTDSFGKIAGIIHETIGKELINNARIPLNIANRNLVKKFWDKTNPSNLRLLSNVLQILPKIPKAEIWKIVEESFFQTALKHILTFQVIENDNSLDESCSSWIVLTETGDHPFALSQKDYDSAKELTKKIVTGEQNPQTQAYLIFRWMKEHIHYDDQFSYREGYYNAHRVLTRKKGVCGELAYLYIVLVRALGIKARWVAVERDCHGKNVCHACAAIFVPNLILVDPAYYAFDIVHQKYRVLSDQEAYSHFKNICKQD